MPMHCSRGGWSTARGLLLALGVAATAPAAALDLYDFETGHGREQLRVYSLAQQDFLAASDVPSGVTTRSSVLRRARVGLRLRWYDDWIGRASGDFARRAALRDLSVEYRGWPARLEFGRFPEPFSLGGTINSSDTLLLNRPSPVLLGPDYGFGLAVSLRGEDWGLGAGAFSRNVGTTLAGRYPQNALTTRVTWRPWSGRAGFLHLGADVSLRQMRSGTGVQLSGTIESSLVSGLTPHAALESGHDLYRIEAAESAARLGPAVLIGEYLRADVQGGPSWSGEYVEAAWALTGERRGYSTRYGTLGGVTPDRPVYFGGIGAWELAARWSRTDLRQGGGDLGRIASAALNWYPVDALRVSFGFERAHLELHSGTVRDGSLAQLRVQVAF